jgi:hypothetical protein
MTNDNCVKLQHWIAPAPLVGVERRFVPRSTKSWSSAPAPLVGVERGFEKSAPYVDTVIMNLRSAPTSGAGANRRNSMSGYEPAIHPDKRGGGDPAL